MENQFGYVNYNGFVPEDPKIAQKKEIRRTALFVGLPVLSFSVITALWSSVYIAVMAIFGYSTAEALKTVQDPAIMQVVQILLSILMFTVP